MENASMENGNTLSSRGVPKNRNSSLLDGFFCGGKRGSEKGTCWRYLAGLCPRFSLFRTPYKVGKCHFLHKKQCYFTPTGRMIDTICAEIHRILSRTDRREVPNTPMHAEYVKQRECLAVHTINSNVDMVGVLRKRIEETENKYEKERVPYYLCDICPGRMPWSRKNREAHRSSTLHLAYKEMRHFLERNRENREKKRIYFPDEQGVL